MDRETIFVYSINSFWIRLVVFFCEFEFGEIVKFVAKSLCTIFEYSSFSWTLLVAERGLLRSYMSVNGEVADDGGEEATSGKIEERMEDFKQDKARWKSSFARIKNKLLRMLDEQDYPSWKEIKEMCHQLSDAQERAMETMHRLSMEYALLKDREKR